MLEIRHLTKQYGEKTAVEDLTLTIRPGEIFGFIGPNGAGKTTTLKCCCGILQPDRGEVRVNGCSMRDDPLAAKRQLAYLPDARAERVRVYGERFALTEALGQPISSYSHGMKQKLAILAALLHAPKLILMDEPFVGLDPLASHQLKQTMRAFCDAGGAIFFSTHVLEVAEKLCDRVAILRKGQLVREGAMEQVRGDDTLEEVFLELEDTGEAL